jgi:hypothetical protein
MSLNIKLPKIIIKEEKFALFQIKRLKALKKRRDKCQFPF